MSTPMAFQFVVVGDDSCGKTTMLCTFLCRIQGTVPDFTKTAIHQNKPVLLNLRDTNAHQDYDILRPLAYPQTDCFLICFSLVSLASLHNAQAKWVPEIRKHAPGVPIILIGTKKDLLHDAAYLEQMHQRGLETVTTAQGNDVATVIGACSYFEISSITQENLNQVFDRAMDDGLLYRDEQLKKKQKECCNIM